ncbi:MAG: glutathione S-transferase N-terminal domain-containing protein [Gammaproteobacteria bacterium]|nr:glutathione S-transferase N-terminal domain-containing protein [Gammaproteobacteria bacterium]
MMKLFYTNTSPYSRKVRITLLEKRLDGEVEYILCNPFEDAVELKGFNPLGKIPTLVLDDGRVVYDSPVICEYLDTLNSNSELVPSNTDARLLVNTWQALADGIVDASYNTVMEGRRDESERSQKSIERWQGSIVDSLKQIERQIGTLPDEITMAQISLAGALGYLDFRLSYLEWRKGQSNTVAWYEEFAKRASMVETQPPV